MIIDAKDLIVGRLGTFVAKQALLGEKIDIINSELAVITGKKEMVLAKYKQKADRGVPAKGPHYRRQADRFLKRLIRNMLPFKQERGKTAFKNIMCWRGVPPEFEGKETTKVPGASIEKVPHFRYVKIKDIVKHLGGKVE